MAAEGNTPDNWKPVLDYYHALLSQLGWKDLGTVLAGGLLQSGDILKADGHAALEEARKLGSAIL